MSRPAKTCKNGHPLAGRNVWVGAQLKWCKRLQRFNAYPKRVCRLCRLRANVDTRFSLSLPFDARISGDMSGFGFSKEETAFLLANVKSTDRVFEWGTGGTTVALSGACRAVTSVEHQANHAVEAISWAGDLQWTGSHPNVSVLYVPPDLPYVEGTDDDGDLSTFRSYIESYSGRGIDVVLIDGRARCAAALWVAERAPFGPHPNMRIFLHDCDREQLWPIFKDTLDADGNVTALRMFEEISRVERLALLKVRQ